jgi:hypothetical protein
VHEGRLIIKGRAPDGLTCLHGDGRPLGAPPPAEPARPDPSLCEDAASALVNLSFPKARARAAVQDAAAQVGADVTFEGLVRKALRGLRRD